MKSPVFVGVGSALLVALFLVAFAQNSSLVTRAPAAVDPLVVAPDASMVEALRERLGIASSTATTSQILGTETASIKKAPKAGAAAAPAPASAPAPDSIASALAAPSVSQAQLNAAAAKLQSAIVNILCAPHDAASTLHAISGSGVIIDPRGIILTDAHIGQFFLLEHGAPALDAYDCIIRTGSPAQVAYTADPLYVSSAWVEKNSKVITEAQALGSGEYDVALLAIDGSATRSPLPSSFPYVEVARSAPYTGDQVIIGSYAAQYLDAVSIRSALDATVVYTNIKDIFTFGNNTIDIVSLGGSIAAQEGSSGGGVVNPQGQLVALITTSTVEGDLTKRELRALSAPYVRRVISNDLGSDVGSYLTHDISSLIALYAPTARYLASIITTQVGQ